MRKLKLFVLAILLCNFLFSPPAIVRTPIRRETVTNQVVQTTHREITDPRARRRTLVDTKAVAQ
jgi:hypothetical protein